MYKQLRIKRWTGTFLIPFLLIFSVLDITNAAAGICGHNTKNTWTVKGPPTAKCLGCTLPKLLDFTYKLKKYTYQWVYSDWKADIHNLGTWKTTTTQDFLIKEIGGCYDVCGVFEEGGMKPVYESHAAVQIWDPNPFSFPKCCQDSDCDSYDDGFSCVPDETLEKHDYNNCVQEQCKYTVVSSFDCNSLDGPSCDGNTLKEMDWSCVVEGGCVGATLSSTNCDSLDVAATCDSPGKDYSCSGDSCQFTEIPKLTGNQDCPECTTPSDCGANVAATCDSTGIDYSCNGGECGSTSISKLTGNQDCPECTTASDCGADTAATCSSSGTSYSCSSGSCGSSTISQLTGGDCDDDDSSSGNVVTLISFTITVSDGNVLEWETASEIDNAGFYIKRSEEKDGEYIRITDLIPTEGGERDGSTYTFTDENVEDGVTYYYKLEDIDFSGKSTFWDPVSNSPDKVLIIGPVIQNSVFTPDTPPIFEWAEDHYSEFKFQFSDDNGQTFYEIPADNQWMKETSITPQATAWEEYAKMKKGQIIFWRVVGKNEQGKAFSEVGSLTIE